MSVWGDMLDRGAGEKERKENLIPVINFSEIDSLPKNLSHLADQIYSVKENTNRLKRELNRLKEQLRRL